jgi:hypothetical protein
VEGFRDLIDFGCEGGAVSAVNSREIGLSRLEVRNLHCTEPVGEPQIALY